MSVSDCLSCQWYLSATKETSLNQCQEGRQAASCRGNKNLYSGEIAEETVTTDLHKMFWDICNYQSPSLMSLPFYLKAESPFFHIKISYFLLTASFFLKKKKSSPFMGHKTSLTTSSYSTLRETVSAPTDTEVITLVPLHNTALYPKVNLKLSPPPLSSGPFIKQSKNNIQYLGNIGFNHSKLSKDFSERNNQALSPSSII